MSTTPHLLNTTVSLRGRNQDFKNDSEREKLAKWLSCLIEGVDHEVKGQGIPYMPNEGQTDYWTLDAGNDFKVQFFDEDPERFDLTHRYNHHKAAALARWVTIRSSYTIDRTPGELEYIDLAVIRLVQSGDADAAVWVAHQLHTGDQVAVCEFLDTIREKVRNLPFDQQTIPRTA